MIDNIKKLFEKLSDELTIVINNAIVVEEFNKQLQERELSLIGKTDDLKNKENILNKEMIKIDEQRAYLKKVKMEIEGRERFVNDKSKEFDKKTQEFDQKLAEITKEEAELDKKRIKMAEYNEKLKDLEFRERVLAKETSVLSERKKILDFKENELNQKAERLQRMISK